MYGYIYYIDGGTVIEKKEWPGTRMTSSGDMYVMKYDKEWFDKGKLIIVDKENEENVFPKKDSLGLKLEGNINIMPKK